MRVTSFAAVLTAALCTAPLATAATVDSSFDTTGRATDYLDLGASKADHFADVAIAASTGSFYSVGRVEHVDTGGPTFGVLFKRLADGSKDGTFFNGSNPSSRATFPAERSGGSSALNAVAFDGSYRGAVMVAGFNDLSNGKRCGVVYKVLDRIAARGPLDTSFGSGGRYSYCSPHNAETVFNDIKVLPDGRALVAGTSAKPGGETYGFLLRLTTAGTLDPSFGPATSPGVFTMDVRPGKDESGLRIAVAPQGYYLAGNSIFAPHPTDPWIYDKDVDLWVIRLTPQGTFDTSFNGNGLRIEAIDLPGSDKNDLLADIAVDASGRLVMLGNINPAHIVWGQYGYFDPDRTNKSQGVLIRYTASGARDTTFGGSGRLDLTMYTGACYAGDFCDYDEPSGLLILPDNRLLVSGRFVPSANLGSIPASKMTLRVVSSDGVTSSGQTFTQWTRTEGGAMVRQADGKFLIGGLTRTSFLVTDADFVLTRFFAP